MKLSTRTRYGVRALVDLAQRAVSGPVPLREIAKSQRLSKPYLEQIVGRLRAFDLVRVVRGSQGGILLARTPVEMRLDEIVTALEGPMVVVDCVVDPGACEWHEECVTRPLWGEIKEAIDDVLRSYTLQDLVDRANEA